MTHTFPANFPDHDCILRSHRTSNGAMRASPPDPHGRYALNAPAERQQIT